MKKLFIILACCLLSACETVQLYPNGQTPAQQAANTSSTTTATTPTNGSTFRISIASQVANIGFDDVLTADGNTYYLDATHTLNRNDLSDAVAKQNIQGQAWVELTFTPEGAKKLFDITSQNSGKELAVTIKGQLIALLNIDSTKSTTLIIPMQSAYQANALQQQIADGE